jgi:methyl-accepting chemotaxis protein
VAAAARVGNHAGTLEYVTTGANIINEMRAVTFEIFEITDAISAAEIKNATAIAARTIWILLGVAIAAAVIAVIIGLGVANVITKPLSKLTGYMNRAGSTGDIAFTPDELATIEQQKNNKDEVGQCIGAINSLISHVAHISQELEEVAKGDLTTQVEFLSQKDVMGIALQHMVDNLNRLFGEINNSTAQVSSGSKQIADGAQALAQGSSEQASAVEQLSAEISAIAEKTKGNADMAGRAANLANTIKGNAEKGSRQMDEMMSAVKDINQASQSISKVIKVIDDIAFQTNILALNAAVEAARAGQHGKGFAVVAEEVRNLAAKSAEAAKETGNLISNSTEKAELGSRIAEDTAASLAEIVSGINESSHIVGEIAKSSEEQSAGIEQITHGIDQVAKVVQQNSATAEESAAASEEMSGQSSTLEDLVAQFKLKDGGSAHRGISSGLGRKSNQIIMPETSSYAPDGSRDYGKY